MDSCPDACLNDETAHLNACKRVKSCTLAGFYVAVGEDSQDQLQTASNLMPPNSHLFYHLKAKGSIMNTLFNLLLFRMQ